MMFVVLTGIAAVGTSLSIITESAWPAGIALGTLSLYWGQWLLDGLIQEFQGLKVETPPDGIAGGVGSTQDAVTRPETSLAAGAHHTASCVEPGPGPQDMGVTLPERTKGVSGIPPTITAHCRPALNGARIGDLSTSPTRERAEVVLKIH